MSRGKAVMFELNKDSESYGDVIQNFQVSMADGLPKKERKKFRNVFNSFSKFLESRKKRGGRDMELPYTDWYTGTVEGDTAAELLELNKKKDYSWNSFKNLLEKQNLLGKFANKDKIDEYTNYLKDYIPDPSSSSSSGTSESELERQARIGRGATKAMETERQTGKKKSKAPSESVKRAMRLTKLKKLFEGDLNESSRNLLKRVVASALSQYSNGLAKYKAKTDEQKQFLSNIRSDLQTKKGTVSVAQVKKVLDEINLNDDDLLKIVSSFLSLSNIKNNGNIDWPGVNDPQEAYVTRLNSYIRSNATQIKQSGKKGGTTFEKGLEEGTGKWKTGSLLNLMEYLLSTEPEDMDPNRLGLLTDDQRNELNRKISDKMVDITRRNTCWFRCS
jgi:transcription termination factor NusB